VGTAGQRCTSVRRLVLHESIHDKFLERLLAANKTVRIGDPLAEGSLMGPIHTAAAVKEFEEGIAEAQVRLPLLLTFFYFCSSFVLCLIVAI
jgi:acyl-CoA reductase-like NAD-dependent aldehyde dehydrogenase